MLNKSVKAVKVRFFRLPQILIKTKIEMKEFYIILGLIFCFVWFWSVFLNLIFQFSNHVFLTFGFIEEDLFSKQEVVIFRLLVGLGVSIATLYLWLIVISLMILYLVAVKFRKP